MSDKREKFMDENDLQLLRRLFRIVDRRMRRHSFVARTYVHCPDPFWVMSYVAIGNPIPAVEHIPQYGVTLPLCEGTALHKRLLDMAAKPPTGWFVGTDRENPSELNLRGIVMNFLPARRPMEHSNAM